MWFSDNNWLTNFYNLENRLSGVRLPSGVSVTNFYDFAGRLTNRSSTIGETASFEYNGNDAVTRMTDNTGGTTNLYDAAGRLWGIDYPSGASVRYQLDVLNRIIGITNKTSMAGAAYVTRYQYDALGNVTNVIDPFNGNTVFEYDRVGRRIRRVLPNNVVTEWQYDWRDRVTNLVHKTSGGTEIARVRYTRNAGGEPSKVMRDDNGSHSYVVLSYDAAWRLQSESHYMGGANGSGGTLNETITYTYDASGNRTKVVNNSGTFTNGIASGYRLLAVTNSGTGLVVENYGYDTGGRMTNLVRTGQNLRLGYNSADQVTQVIVTNGGATFHDYEYDAAGRRTRAKVNGTVTRKFLVAPTPGYDLESPLVVADASDNFQLGWLYVDGRPTQRYTSNGSGNTVYYLEDGMGSVIGLVDANQSSVAVFTYDGFGQTRSATGSQASPPSSSGGDFRFHGGWLESATALYHFRARDYDPHLGRFTSRDSLEGDFQAVESFHPYQYGNNNPFVFTDPSGTFSFAELLTVQGIQRVLMTLKTIAVNYARQWAKDKISDFAIDSILNVVAAYLPDFINPDKMKWLKAGNAFSKIVRDLLCETPMSDYLFFEVSVKPSNGTPLNNGLNCSERDLPDPILPGKVRPDIIIGRYPPLDANNQPNKTWLVMETKIRTSSYLEYRKSAKKRKQMYGIMRYAKNHVSLKTAVFVSFTRGKKDKAKDARKYLMEQAGLEKGVRAIPFSFDPREWGRPGKRK